MINIFDLSAGMSGTKVLTDEVHRGSPVNRCLTDAMKKVSDPGSQIEDKKVINESRSSSNKKYGGTPMKLLIAQEMTKEMETLQNPPTVVARLMGLEALPAQQSATVAQRVNPEHIMHKSSTTAGTIWTHRRQKNLHHERLMPCRCRDQHFHTPVEHRNYKNVYEVWQQPSRINHFKDEPRSRERYTETDIEKRMSIVRQKFMEAKRLATNQKLLHSKEFQDALDVLSSNRDIFLKFLEEPNPLFSNHINESQTVSTLGQPKHITILKPSKTLDMGAGKLLNNCHLPGQAKRCDKSKFSHGSDSVSPKIESYSRKTRIVVLKPSPGELNDAKAMTASPTFSPTLLERKCLFDEPENDEAKSSREVAKEIARHMRESLSSNQIDETMLSSVLSNGYIGDESSFDRSEDEFLEEECGNFSDSEYVTPRQSWDYPSRFDSPCSELYFSLSHDSFSPESSVIQEAKRRISQRWVMVASNQMNKKGRQEWRNTYTLSEMLAAPKTDKEERRDEAYAASSSRSFGGAHDLMVASSDLHSNRDKVEYHVKRSLNLLRSKSLPVSSLAYEKVELDMEVPKYQVASSTILKDKEIAKLKGGKSNFKEKVSNFFFSRTKKSTQGKPSSSSLAGQSYNQYGIAEHHGKKNNGSLDCATDYSTDKGGPTHKFEKLLIENPYPSTEQAGQSQMISSLEKHLMSDNAHGNEEHTLRSVLEQPFKDISSQYADGASISCPRAISRSPPIESVARSLSFDGSMLSGRAKTNSLKHSTNFLKADVEEKERLLFVQSLLSSAGLGTKTSSTFLARWHSLESPLNPALLDKLLEHKDWTRCREKRSTQRLLFDCVNAALLEISWNGVLSIDWLRTSCGIPTTNSVTEDVLGHIKEWFSNDKLMAFTYGDTSSLEVDNFVRKEVSGKRWSKMMGSEIAEIGMIIEGQVLEELVGEALDDFISGWLQ